MAYEKKKKRTKSKYDLNYDYSEIYMEKLNDFSSAYILVPEKEVYAIQVANEILCDIGITPFYKGYNYIIDAVRIMYRKGFTHILITKDIYIPLARLYKTNPELIEHCIRTAIKRAWDTPGNEEAKKRVFKDMEKCPTNHQFLVSLTLVIMSIILG